MQRLTRLPRGQLSERSVRLLPSMLQVVAALGAYDPPLASLLALPEDSGEMVEFYSPLEGELIATTLDSGQVRLQQALKALSHLEASGTLTPAVCADVRYFLTSGSMCYLVGGTFCLVPAETQAQAAAIAATAAPVVATRSHLPCIIGLLALLLLLGLLFALWWFKLRPWPFATPEPVVEPTPPVATVPVEEPKVEPKPSPVEVKPEPAPEPKPEPVVEPEPKPKVAPAPEVKPEPAPLAPPKKEVVKPKPAKPVVKSAPAKPKLPKCSELRQKNKLPALIMGIDGSGSMLLRDITDNRTPVTRLQVAHQAAMEVVQGIDKNVGVGLVEINRCNSAINHGYFGANNRHALLAAISQVVPKGNGTALVSGLRSMSNMVAGREAVGILLSDGLDTCRGTSQLNICDVARQIHRQNPQFKINVVLIGGAVGNLNCVAEITGGKVYTPRTAQEFTKGLQQAASSLEQVCEE
ncbi:MAG: VWA domain-containing protein [Candidatus Anaerobiospirillum merdipullorum]|uniref:VWA domain-containing protein n=1 Tax=Candidatus Anaerobiospirillum merdipullorum TaxID=2838450 RepID=A0A9E2NST2_9GAMM|nr:VWA domain-containing protein [Candidatus Anaerobiospirillum merdipullorum]